MVTGNCLRSGKAIRVQAEFWASSKGTQSALQLDELLGAAWFKGDSSF